MQATRSTGEMTYTLWSHGELLGESALDYVRVFPRLRTGDLHVTPKGLTLLERLTGTRADAYYIARALNRGALDEAESKTLYANLAAGCDQHEALALELRGRDGSVIPTESIDVTDTDYLLAIAAESDEEDASGPDSSLEGVLDPDDLNAVEEMLGEFEEERQPWIPEPPPREPVRFQLSVRLKDEWSIP